MNRNSLLAYTELTKTTKQNPISKLTKRHKLALEYIKKYPNKTAYELAIIAGHNDPNYFRPRICELNKAGLIYSPYSRTCHATPEGSTAHVWAITP